MFSGCDNIKEVEFDCDKIMPIFSGFTSIEKITIKEGAASIDDNAFSECSGITSVEIPSSIISIGSGAFYGCYNINDSLISLNNVATIGDKAFYGCSKIKNITLSKNLTTISAYVFYECSGLTSIEIPNSVTSIGNNAFNGCSGISNSIKVPNSVTIIGDYAFNKCNNVKDFYVGDGVTNIGKCAFANCDKMENFYCYAYHYPKTKDDVFKDSYIDYVTLYVPKDVVNQYKAVEPWKNFKEIVGVDYESGIFLANTENACFQCTGGIILLSGIELGKMINVYDVSGKLVGSTKSNTNKISICTNLKKGEVAIIKIGDKSVKVVME